MVASPVIVNTRDHGGSTLPLMRSVGVNTNRHSTPAAPPRSEEHTSELQSHVNLVCRLLLEKKKSFPPSVPRRKPGSRQLPRCGSLCSLSLRSPRARLFGLTTCWDSRSPSVAPP